MAADERVKDMIRQCLREEFPGDTVDVSDGYRDNIHVIVVSRIFDRFDTDRECQEFTWNLIDQLNLTEAEKNSISLLLPMSPAQLK